MKRLMLATALLVAGVAAAQGAFAQEKVDLDMTGRIRAEAFNLTNTPSFGPPASDINAPNTFGTITTTVSTARTVEFVLKFFF